MKLQSENHVNHARNGAGGRIRFSFSLMCDVLKPPHDGWLMSSFVKPASRDAGFKEYLDCVSTPLMIDDV